MGPNKTAESLKAMLTRTRHTSPQHDGPLPLDLDELDRRLEAAYLSISGFHANEPCIWACGCFLVDGSES
jgi:hypothetical protein